MQFSPCLPDAVRADVVRAIRDATGGMTTIDVPGSTATEPISINDNGLIAGFYSDSTGQHGFVRQP